MAFVRAAWIALCVFSLSAMTAAEADFGKQRPDPSQRRFHSPAIESLISSVASRMLDPVLANIFANCLPNTLDTTIENMTTVKGFYDTFVITGDIHAMWLRDSTNQVLPYLPFMKQDPSLRNMICGVINRQTMDVLSDNYANAFNFQEEGGEHQGDARTPPMSKHVFEGKYELDSLAAVLKLSAEFGEHSEDIACFAPHWLPAIRRIVATIRAQQTGTEEEESHPQYLFARETDVATDTLMLQSRGPPAARCGLSKGAFRPSDDASTFPFLIPANAMVAVELRRIASLLRRHFGSEAEDLAADCLALAAELRAAIDTFGILHHVKFGSIYAYEVDGFGSAYFMDDANIPSLLSLPYLGYLDSQDPVYMRTRSMILSSSNPFFFKGSAGMGVGGPHVGFGFIWPMSVIMQAMTSDSEEEIVRCLEILKQSAVSTGFMHESFHKDDPNNYTRSWFAWANSLFGHLVLKLVKTRPHLLLREPVDI
eukprot:GILK01007019.1.p1 GENE.GILK01007019.1~~GILK01007019.1.p1  ORF type:complete len:482 (-),score=59.72 GILK01007019.1:101-1546(-)